MIGLNPGCLTGIPEWDRYKSVRYVSDTGGVLSQGVGENTHVKYGVGESNKNLSREIILSGQSNAVTSKHRLVVFCLNKP